MSNVTCRWQALFWCFLTLTYIFDFLQLHFFFFIIFFLLSYLSHKTLFCWPIFRNYYHKKLVKTNKSFYRPNHFFFYFVTFFPSIIAVQGLEVSLIFIIQFSCRYHTFMYCAAIDTNRMKWNRMRRISFNMNSSHSIRRRFIFVFQFIIMNENVISSLFFFFLFSVCISFV